MNQTALFRFDSGHGIGLGHFSRCLSLAEALRQQQVRRVMLTAPDQNIDRQVAAADHIARRRTEAGDGRTGDLDEVIAVAAEYGCRWVVVDSYTVTADGQRRLRDAGLCVVAIDDLASEPLPAQIVVNGGAQARDLPYRSSTGDSRFLLGTDYALLRPEFWHQAARTLNDRVSRVLITVGGSDTAGATPAILREVDRHASPFSIVIVSGPFFADHEPLRRCASECRHPVTVAHAPASLLPLMREADVTIAGGGQTLYELAATGTPTVAVQLADNQSASLASLAGAGVVLNGGVFSGGAPSPALAASFAELLASEGLRRRLSRQGQQTVDGRGAERVAAEMLGAA